MCQLLTPRVVCVIRPLSFHDRPHPAADPVSQHSSHHPAHTSAHQSSQHSAHACSDSAHAVSHPRAYQHTQQPADQGPQHLAHQGQSVSDQHWWPGGGTAQAHGDEDSSSHARG